MGFLNRFFKPEKSKLVHLPSGSFTVDREGKVMTSTLPQSVPADHMKEIGDKVLAAFRGAERAQMPMAEIIIHYAALKILARELRGGAMVFLMPQTPTQRSKKLP
jgi:hypothetical protein